MSRNKLNITKNYNITTTNGFVSTNFEPGNTIHQLFDGIIPAVDSTGEDMLKINNADSYGQIELTAKANSPGDIIDEIVIHLATARPLNIFALVRAEGGGTNLESVAIGASTAGPNSLKFSNPNSPIREILIGFSAAAFQNTSFCLIGEIEFFGSDRTPNFEFNDSVLSTKAWNSSRYDGKQLKGTLLNKYNSSNDISYGKTPVLQKYTRNIYIGNTVLSGDPGAEDNENLLSFPNHSFVTTRKYITINSDDSISEYELENPEPDNLKFIRGYLRRFRQDFEEHSNMRIILLDDTVSSNLDPAYKIYSNIGLLKKVVTFKPIEGNVLGTEGTIATQTSSYAVHAIRNDFTSNTDDGFGRIYISSHFPPEKGAREDGVEEERYNTGMTVGINSLTELEKVYTGSFFGGTYTIGIPTSTGKFSSVSYVSGVSNFVPSNKVREFFNGITTFQNTNFDLRESKRYFISLCESGSDTPLQLGRTGSISGSLDFYASTDPFVNKDLELADFSTVEFMGSSGTVQTLNVHTFNAFDGDETYANNGYIQSFIKVKDNLRQNYMSNDMFSHTITTSGNAAKFLGSAGEAQYFNTSSLNYHPTSGSSAFPQLFATGSVIVSRADITIPSMLIPLSKTEQLPDGVGSKPFILIPQNLHPFIKDNLTHFLMKAGLDTGDRKVLPEIKEKFRNLP